MFEGVVIGWRNASLDSARLNMEAEIGARSTILGIGYVWPKLKELGNDIVVRPAKAVAGLIVKPEEKAPAPMPETPKEFAGQPLGAGLAKAYQQKCDSVIAGAEAGKRLVNLDLAGYQRSAALAKHSEALNDVSLPENRRSNDAGLGFGLGGLVANIPESVKNDMAQGIVKKATAMLT